MENEEKKNPKRNIAIIMIAILIIAAIAAFFIIRNKKEEPVSDETPHYESSGLKVISGSGIAENDNSEVESYSYEARNYWEESVKEYEDGYITDEELESRKEIWEWMQSNGYEEYSSKVSEEYLDYLLAKWTAEDEEQASAAAAKKAEEEAAAKAAEEAKKKESSGKTTKKKNVYDTTTMQGNWVSSDGEKSCHYDDKNFMTLYTIDLNGRTIVVIESGTYNLRPFNDGEGSAELSTTSTRYFFLSDGTPLFAWDIDDVLNYITINEANDSYETFFGQDDDSYVKTDSNVLYDTYASLLSNEDSLGLYEMKLVHYRTVESVTGIPIIKEEPLEDSWDEAKAIYYKFDEPGKTYQAFLDYYDFCTIYAEYDEREPSIRYDKDSDEWQIARFSISGQYNRGLSVKYYRESDVIVVDNFYGGVYYLDDEHIHAY